MSQEPCPRTNPYEWLHSSLIRERRPVEPEAARHPIRCSLSARSDLSRCRHRTRFRRTTPPVRRSTTTCTRSRNASRACERSSAGCPGFSQDAASWRLRAVPGTGRSSSRRLRGNSLPSMRQARSCAWRGRGSHQAGARPLCSATRIGSRLQRQVDGSSTPIAERDEDGNTYQVRSLRDGSTHEALKNYPSKSDLLDAIYPAASQIRFDEWRYFRALEYVYAPKPT